jgi:hypothetical protein
MARAMLFEEILLLAYHDTKGNPESGIGRFIDFGLGGGVLAELALADRIRVELAKPDTLNPYHPFKDTLAVTDPTPLGDRSAFTVGLGPVTQPTAVGT